MRRGDTRNFTRCRKRNPQIHFIREAIRHVSPHRGRLEKAWISTVNLRVLTSSQYLLPHASIGCLEPPGPTPWHIIPDIEFPPPTRISAVFQHNLKTRQILNLIRIIRQNIDRPKQAPHTMPRCPLRPAIIFMLFIPTMEPTGGGLPNIKTTIFQLQAVYSHHNTVIRMQYYNLRRCVLTVSVSLRS